MTWPAPRARSASDPQKWCRFLQHPRGELQRSGAQTDEHLAPFSRTKPRRLSCCEHRVRGEPHTIKEELIAQVESFQRDPAGVESAGRVDGQDAIGVELAGG